MQIRSESDPIGFVRTWNKNIDFGLNRSCFVVGSDFDNQIRNKMN